MSRPLTGRVVAVTGAARGIGRATAAALVRDGARVAIGDLDGALAERTAAEIGGDTVGLQLDVTDRASFAAFLDETERRLGPLDVLVNNAGIMPVVRQEEEDGATTRRIVDINVHGVITGSQLALERMRRHGRGHIINIASQAGKVGFGGVATYCASKHAVVGYTAALADELRDEDIETSVVMPSVVATELTQGLPSPRLLKPIGPEVVAAAIVGVLQRPRLNVHVPRSGGVVLMVMNALPARARHAMEKAMGMDHGVIRLDTSTRAEYEARAAREVHGTAADEREEQLA